MGRWCFALVASWPACRSLVARTMPMGRPRQYTLCSTALVGDRVITPEQHEAALNHVRAFGDRVEETLLERGASKRARS